MTCKQCLHPAADEADWTAKDVHADDCPGSDCTWGDDLCWGATDASCRQRAESIGAGLPRLIEAARKVVAFGLHGAAELESALREMGIEP